MPWRVIKRTIQKELGRPIEDVFLSVDPVPLASASVAQVHCAGEGPFVIASLLNPYTTSVQSW